MCWCWFHNSSGSFCFGECHRVANRWSCCQRIIDIIFSVISQFSCAQWGQAMYLSSVVCSPVYLLARLLVCLSLRPFVSPSLRPSVFSSACLAGFCFWFVKAQHMRWQQIGQTREKMKTIMKSYYEDEQNTRKPNERSNKTNVDTKLMVLKKLEQKHNKFIIKGTRPRTTHAMMIECTPLICCCCLGHHIVLWDGGFGGCCGVVVFT